MILFYLLATILATVCAFFNTFGILEVASTALLVCTCLISKKTKASKIALIYTSSLLIALLSAVAIYYFSNGLSALSKPAAWLTLSQTLQPYAVALPILICLTHKKDPITTATFAIAVSSIFILTANCLSVFISYNKFGLDAIKLFVDDMSSEFVKLIETQDVGILVQKVYVSFMTRMSVSLLPGIFITISVIQVFAIIFVVRLILKEKLDTYHKGPWAVSLSMVSAIINIFCIIAFMSSFFSSSVTTFSAVAGNIMMVLTPASAIMGFAFMMIGIRNGGFFNVILSSLPLLMLFVAPPVAIVYISFIGSANVIFSKIALAVLKIK